MPRKVPKDSPRYKSAMARAQSARESRTGMGEAAEDEKRIQKVRVITGRGPRKSVFQR